MDNIVWHYDNFTPEQRVEVQNAINTMYKGLSAQDWKPSVTISIEGGTKCKYRGEDNRKCAVGHLIPDDVYEPALEQLLPSVDDKLKHVLRTHCGLSHADYSVFAILREYQRIHDRESITTDDVMQNEFEEYTHKCGFTYPMED